MQNWADSPAAARLALRCLSVGCILLAAALGSGCGASASKNFDLNDGDGPEDADRAAVQRLFAQSSSPQDGSEGWSYRMEAGDELEIVFFTHPEQDRFVTVRPDGVITLPFLGDLKAEGREPEELAAEIQERYAEVLVNPRVDVLVQKMGARFYVLGEVQTPGEFPYERRLDILQAIAQAGGHSRQARLNNLVLLRKDGDGKAMAAILDFRGYMEAKDRQGSIEIRPDDIVWVPRNMISRFDDTVTKAFTGLLRAEDFIIKGWSMTQFDDVFATGARNP